MTTYNNFSGRNRDNQDGVERHVWDDIEYISDAGAIVKVNGTGTIDEEATLLNSGYGFNLPQGEDTEVLLFSGGSDTNQKFAMPQIPHKQQRQWPKKAGGVQNPMDKDKALEFSPDMVHLRDVVVALHENGILEVRDGEVIIRGNIKIEGSVQAGGTISTPSQVQGVHTPPGSAPTIGAFTPFNG